MGSSLLGTNWETERNSFGSEIIYALILAFCAIFIASFTSFLRVATVLLYYWCFMLQLLVLFPSPIDYASSPQNTTSQLDSIRSPHRNRHICSPNPGRKGRGIGVGKGWINVHLELVNPSGTIPTFLRPRACSVSTSPPEWGVSETHILPEAR